MLVFITLMLAIPTLAYAKCAGLFCTLFCSDELVDRGVHLHVHFTTEIVLCDFFGGDTLYTTFAESEGKRVAIQENGYEEGLPGQEDYVEFLELSPKRLQITYPMALFPKNLNTKVGSVEIVIKINNLGWTKNWLKKIEESRQTSQSKQPRTTQQNSANHP